MPDTKTPSYFSRLKQHSKWLYVGVVLYCAITLLLTAVNIQIAPFLVWNMYAAKENPELHKSYTIYELYINGKKYNQPTWKDHSKMFFTYTIPKYDALHSNDNKDAFEDKIKNRLRQVHFDTAYTSVFTNDSTQIKAYPKWLKRYMEQSFGSITDMKVKKIWVHYEKEKLIADSATYIINEQY